MLKLFFLIPYNVIIYTYTLLIFFISAYFGWIVALFYKDKKWGHIKTTFPLLKGLFLLLGLKITVKGLDNIPKKATFIIASNHQSHFDTTLLQCHIPRRFNFLSKKELTKVPILGRIMKNQGQVPIDRNNAKVAMQQMDTLKQQVMNGDNLLIFPEGTRTKDGHIAPFKRGSFQLASQTQTMIIPCYLNGTFDLLNKNQFLCRPFKNITITFLPPISVPETQSKKEEKELSVHLMKQTQDALLRCEKNEFN